MHLICTSVIVFESREKERAMISVFDTNPVVFESTDRTIND